VAKGIYGVVQHCPDRFRAEAVNVGLVLLRPDPHALRVQMTANHEWVRKLLGVARPELRNLKVSAHGLPSRIEKSPDEFRTSEALAASAASRANDRTTNRCPARDHRRRCPIRSPSRSTTNTGGRAGDAAATAPATYAITGATPSNGEAAAWSTRADHVLCTPAADRSSRHIGAPSRSLTARAVSRS
jgi:hypothetical protein